MIEVLNVALTSLQYAFTKPDANTVEISTRDEIRIQKPNDEIAVIRIMRTMDFGQDTNSYIKVSYDLVLKNPDGWDEKDVQRYCDSTVSALTGVYSKISLLISEITNESPFGAIITPPAFLGKKDSTPENA